MPWLQSIRDVLVEDDPKPTVAAPHATLPTPVMLFNPTAQAMVYAAPPIQPTSSAFLDKLRSKLNTQGGAVEKFEKTLRSLNGITDENVRLSSALAVIKDVGGVDAQALLQEYSARRQQLDAEVQSFASVMSGQRKSEIDDKQSQIKAIDDQIQHLSIQRQSMVSAIDNAKAKLENSQAGFNAAVNVVRGEIDSALNKLKGSQV